MQRTSIREREDLVADYENKLKTMMDDYERKLINLENLKN